MSVTLRGLNQTPSSDTLQALSAQAFPVTASIGAGVANTTVQQSILLPFHYKIRKVVVMFSAIDAVAGLDSFNLVLGGFQGATGQTYTQGNVVANDNSFSGNLPGGVGYPTNLGIAGQSVFAADIPINVANTYTPYNPQTGTGTGTGWISATTTGGVGIFVPTNYDAVYPVSVPLTLRATTVASTGSISNLYVVLGIVPLPYNIQQGRPNQVLYPVPGQNY